MAAIIELNDDEWKLVGHLFDPGGRRGAPARYDRREMVAAILFLARSGCQWRYLPERYPPWEAVWQQWRRWRDNGVWGRAMTLLARTIRQKHGRKSDPSIVMIDAQTVRGGRAGPTFHEAGGRGGRTIGAKRSILIEILAFRSRCAVHNAPMRFHLRSIGKSPDRRPTMPEQDVAWIAANRRPFSDFAVGSLVPVVFEGYARVLHPAWASLGVPVRWETVATWTGRRIHSLAQWDFLFRLKGEPSGPAPFVADPDTNGLPPQQLAALCELLAAHTSTPDLCFVGVWEGYGWAADSEWSAAPTLRLEERTFLVRQGPLGLALAVGRDGASGGFSTERPSIFWPADRAWFVTSDPDLDSTYLGGSNALIEAVLAHPDLEAWPATAEDLVSIGSDEINAG